MLINLQSLIYTLLTLLIPLSHSYTSVRQSNTQQQKLWAVYWAFYCTFKSLQESCWLFQYRPVDFVFVLLALWIYNDQYQGGLFLAEWVERKIQGVPAIANVVNLIADKAGFLHLFEKSPVFGQTAAKPKVQ